MVTAFLQHIYHDLPGDCRAEIACMAPPGRAIDGPARRFYYPRLGDDFRLWPRLWALNTAGYGIHYGLTAKSRAPARGHRSNEADTAWASVLWCDVDFDTMPHTSRQAAFAAIQAFTPAATAVVFSGGGYQVLWRIEPVAVTAESRLVLRHTLRGLALALGGDAACAELARTFRLPGTFNTKPTRRWAMCELVGDPLPWQHNLAAFVEYTALGIPPPRQTCDVRLADGARLALPRWVQRYLEAGAPGGRRNRTLFGAAIEAKANGYDQAEAAALLLPRALADGLSENEAKRTVASAYRSEITSTPNLPRHIAARLPKR